MEMAEQSRASTLGKPAHVSSCIGVRLSLCSAAYSSKPPNREGTELGLSLLVHLIKSMETQTMLKISTNHKSIYRASEDKTFELWRRPEVRLAVY